MAISATQIATSNTLENFRQQFNNLQTDVNGLESGTLTFSSVSATTTSTSALNILEDGTIVFEGATDSTNETTLTVTDPTADRTITLPDATGTVFLTETTDTAIFSDKTALSSGDVVSGTDVLLIADISATTLKKITVDNIFSSVGGLASLAGDSTPQLGGDLDVNGNKITSASNANVEIEPNGTGNILLDSDLITLGSGTEVGHLSTPGTQDIKLSTNSGTDSGTIVITDGANNDITLTPNGTGDVVLSADSVTVGDSGAAATLTSNGAGALTVTTGGATDLTLSTNGGTNSGTIVITDGANGDITLTPNGTGDVVLVGDTVTVGDAGAAATLSSNGAGTLTVTTGGATDLIMNTNGGTNSSALKIVDAANGNIEATLNGTAVFQVDGTNGIAMESGAISIKNSGAQSYVRFYCEDSNAHYVQLQAPAHADFSGDVTVTLPVGTATVSTLTLSETLTNKTLTSPVLNTATVGTSIVPASADGATLGTAAAEFSDLFLADGGVIKFGNDQEITLTHVADTGLILKHAATADDKFPTLTLQTGDTDIAANDKLGVLNFQAPDEGTGSGDAILVAAGIEAVSEGDFSASNNATKLSFKTAASAAAAETMSLSSAGLLTTSAGITSGALITSGAGLVIADAGTIGSASDTDAIAIAANGVVTFSQAVSGTSADFDGGVTIDNFSIDGTTFALTSGDLTVDVAGDISLDANGGDINFKDDGTQFGSLTNSSTDFVVNTTTSDKDFILKGNDGGTQITALTIDYSAAGAATFNADVTAFSDERIKTDIKTIENGLEKLMKLRGVSYKRSDIQDAKTQIGVIAQEVEEVVPEVVKTADDEMGTKSVDYGKLTALLIESVKELGQVVASDVQRIEKQMESLKNYVYDNLSSYGEDIKELKKMHSKNGHVGDHDHE